MRATYRAIEFFSGIGAFAQAAAELNLHIVAAFDQSQEANTTYQLNYQLAPSAKNLDTIKSKDIPPADVWWLSPPCTPYSLRGNQRDHLDPRSSSLRNLIRLMSECVPSVILLENVRSFARSEMFKLLQKQLLSTGYEMRTILLCPTEFGVPMKRPRMFAACVREKTSFELKPVTAPKSGSTAPLRSFLIDAAPEQWQIDCHLLERYEASLNIVSSENSATLICFTSGYGKSMKASGSYLREANGTVRQFAPQEIVRLLGFSETFQFPDELSDRARWRLAGNSVDVRSISYVLQQISGITPGANTIVE